MPLAPGGECGKLAAKGQSPVLTLPAAIRAIRLLLRSPKRRTPAAPGFVVKRRGEDVASRFFLEQFSDSTFRQLDNLFGHLALRALVELIEL